MADEKNSLLDIPGYTLKEVELLSALSYQYDGIVVNANGSLNTGFMEFAAGTGDEYSLSEDMSWGELKYKHPNVEAGDKGYGSNQLAFMHEMLNARSFSSVVSIIDNDGSFSDEIETALDQFDDFGRTMWREELPDFADITFGTILENVSEGTAPSVPSLGVTQAETEQTTLPDNAVVLEKGDLTSKDIELIYSAVDNRNLLPNEIGLSAIGFRFPTLGSLNREQILNKDDWSFTTEFAAAFDANKENFRPDAVTRIEELITRLGTNPAREGNLVSFSELAALHAVSQKYGVDGTQIVIENAKLTDEFVAFSSSSKAYENSFGGTTPKQFITSLVQDRAAINSSELVELTPMNPQQKADLDAKLPDTPTDKQAALQALPDVVAMTDGIKEELEPAAETAQASTELDSQRVLEQKHASEKSAPLVAKKPDVEIPANFVGTAAAVEPVQNTTEVTGNAGKNIPNSHMMEVSRVSKALLRKQEVEGEGVVGTLLALYQNNLGDGGEPLYNGPVFNADWSLDKNFVAAAKAEDLFGEKTIAKLPDELLHTTTKQKITLADIAEGLGVKPTTSVSLYSEEVEHIASYIKSGDEGALAVENGVLSDSYIKKVAVKKSLGTYVPYGKDGAMVSINSIQSRIENEFPNAHTLENKVLVPDGAYKTQSLFGSVDAARKKQDGKAKVPEQDNSFNAQSLFDSVIAAQENLDGKAFDFAAVAQRYKAAETPKPKAEEAVADTPDADAKPVTPSADTTTLIYIPKSRSISMLAENANLDLENWDEVKLYLEEVGRLNNMTRKALDNVQPEQEIYLPNRVGKKVYDYTKSDITRAVILQHPNAVSSAGEVMNNNEPRLAPAGDITLTIEGGDYMKKYADALGIPAAEREAFYSSVAEASSGVINKNKIQAGGEMVLPDEYVKDGAPLPQFIDERMNQKRTLIIAENIMS